MTEDQAPRQNRDGHPCPPWCTTDHAKPISESALRASYHSTEPPTIGTPAGYVQAVAYQNGFNDAPAQVWLGGLELRGGLMIAPETAVGMAALAEMLADATPDQHRELAAQIRKAAAQITAAGGAQ
jgi:Domain of unknown function (DUF6907)